MTPLPKETRGRDVALLAILLIAALLRLPTLTAQSLWFDEVLTLHSARAPLADLLPTIRSWEDSPPLYFVLINLWSRLAGHSDAALRLPSALAGIAAVYATHRLARRLFRAHPRPAAVALTAALLLAISRYHIAYSQEARGYAILLLLCILSTHAFVALLDGDRRRRTRVAYVATSAASLWIHPFAGIAIVAHLATLLFLLARRRSPALFAEVRLWLTLFGATAVLFGPWVPTFLDLATSTRANFGRMDVLGPLTDYAGSPPLLLLVALLLALASAYAVRHRDPAFVLPLLLATLPALLPVLLALGRASSFTSRYAIAILIGLTLTAAYAVASLPRRIGAATLVLLLALATPPLYTDLRHGRTAIPKPDARSAAAHIAAHASPGDRWAWSDFLLSMPLRRYLGPADLTEADAGILRSPPPSGRVWYCLYTHADPSLAHADVAANTPYRLLSRHHFPGVTVVELAP